MDNLKEQIQNYLHENIPLTKHMQIMIDSISSSEIKMSAKLDPNKNDKNIAFAGSIETLMTICCWSFIYSWLLKRNINARLFIRRCSLEFNRQIEQDFTCICSLSKKKIQKDFINDLKKEKKARVTLNAEILIDSEIAASFIGEYAAIITE